MRTGILTVLLALASVHMAGVALADTTYEGTIAAGHPVTGVLGGVTETATPCDPSSPFTGVDGVWFDVTGSGGSAFTLEMDATLDADAWYYDASCALISDYSGAANGLGVTEAGTLPANVAFIVVDGYMGTGAFTLTISA